MAKKNVGEKAGQILGHGIGAVLGNVYGFGAQLVREVVEHGGPIAKQVMEKGKQVAEKMNSEDENN